MKLLNLTLIFIICFTFVVRIFTTSKKANGKRKKVKNKSKLKYKRRAKPNETEEVPEIELFDSLDYDKRLGYYDIDSPAYQSFDDGKTEKIFKVYELPAISQKDVVPDCGSEVFYLENIKLYERISGWAKKEVMEDEIKQSNADPLHKPSIANALSIEKENNKENSLTPIEHEFIEFCGSCGNKTKRFVIDRDAVGGRNLFSIKNSVFTTRIRITKIPNTNNGSCYEDKNWLYKKVRNRWVYLRAEIDKNDLLSFQQLNYKLDDVLNLMNNYAKRYWRYNGIFNCQHFATNTFNYFTGQKNDFASAEIMGYHALRSGIKPWIEFETSGKKIELGAKLYKKQPIY